jgi:hypothetical protein
MAAKTRQDLVEEVEYWKGRAEEAESTLDAVVDVASGVSEDSDDSEPTNDEDPNRTDELEQFVSDIAEGSIPLGEIQDTAEDLLEPDDERDDDDSGPVS